MANQNKSLKQILKEISSHANTGRILFEQDEEEQEDPLSTGAEEGDETEDPLGDTGDDPGGDLGGDMGDETETTEDSEDVAADAEAEKAKAEADIAKAEADSAKAQAEKEKSEAEREKAEAESDEFNGIDLFSRPGVSFLVGQLLDDYGHENKVDQLAQQFVSKLRLDDEGFQKFKSQSGPLLKLQGFQQLLNRMESMVRSTSDDEIESAVEQN